MEYIQDKDKESILSLKILGLFFAAINLKRAFVKPWSQGWLSATELILVSVA